MILRLCCPGLSRPVKHKMLAPQFIREDSMRDQDFIRQNLPASLTQLNQTGDDRCAAVLDACGITGELADRIRAVWAASEDEHQLIVSLDQDPLSSLNRAAIF